jgi:hypothetical protein
MEDKGAIALGACGLVFVVLFAVMAIITSLVIKSNVENEFKLISDAQISGMFEKHKNDNNKEWNSNQQRAYLLDLEYNTRLAKPFAIEAGVSFVVGVVVGVVFYMN